MRKLGKPDVEWSPRNTEEQLVCERMKELTKKEVSKLWRRDEYEGEVELCDYIVYMSTRYGKWYTGAIMYSVTIHEGRIDVKQIGMVC